MLDTATQGVVDLTTPCMIYGFLLLA